MEAPIKTNNGRYHTYWLDSDDVDIELYVFWGAATMCEVTEHVRSCSRTISKGQGQKR